ncbi:mucin-12-like [Embiotoca jacksoni]|uniref:mucin-12-like n=1 Tax=Embiotoca jacksoni TaxID=100190 RepID=UPI003703CEE4
MWMWILIGFTIVTKVHGSSDGRFPKSCESMAPVHVSRGGILYTPQTTDPPFMVDYLPISKPGEPITVLLKSKQSTNFRGFLLEAREVEDKGRPVGKFIMLEPDTTQLLTCGDLTDSAVSQTNNRQKNLIRVNWTAQGQEQELNVIFRATFVQSFTTFWERVSVPLPQPTSTPEPSTTTSTPEPSTTTSTPEPSTTANTPEPSTTTSTPEPSTTTSTPEPSTTTSTPHPSTTTSTPEPCTTSTPEPSTTTSTPEPSTTTSTPHPSTTTSTPQPSPTTSTPKPSTTTSIPKPSTTKSTTEPLLKDPCTTPFNIGERETTMLMCLDCVLEEIKLEISNVITVLFASSPFYHYVNKVSKIVGSTLCAAVEILSLILVCAGDSCKVTLIALVCVVIVINSIELVIVSLSIGSSHELKGISDFAVKVCFVIHEIFTSAFLQRVLGY